MARLFGLILLAVLLMLVLCSPGWAEQLARDDFEEIRTAFADVNSGVGWAAPWRTSANARAKLAPASQRYDVGSVQLGGGSQAAIQGTGDRNNPLRRPLAEPFSGDELYVRFLIHYEPSAIDQPGGGHDGEFFVMWLDDIDGSDGAPHNTNVPNIGLHVAGGPPMQNQFMVRVGSGNQVFSAVELVGGKTFLVVGRLSKSTPGPRRTFDRFELWVDPTPADRPRPNATVRTRRSLNLVRWIGFATGRKTEPGDRILVDDVALTTTWEESLGLPPLAGAVPTAVAKAKVDFKREVFPLLKSRCFECHQGQDADSGFRLDLIDEILGQTTGQALALPGNSRQSRIIQLVSADREMPERMPPSGEPLGEAEVDLLRDWIDQGMQWDQSLLPPDPPQSDPQSRHWAFEPIRRPPVPQSGDVWVRSPVDAFIAARHHAAKLTPNRAAPRHVLIRRLCLDLLGIPPTPDQVSMFLDDRSPDAVERLVDRLLSSPLYGQRWGRHWLDLARWAESNGHQHNRFRPHAWLYRDYVVRSFNEDKPYDQFIREQIAGDELLPYSDENLIATGFLAAARYSGNELDKDIQRNDILVDIVNATASSLLGLTMECAQCHNHKFDPISARDYYRFQGFFIKGQPGNYVLQGDSAAPRSITSQQAIDQRQRLFESVRARLMRAERARRPEGQILVIPKNVVAAMTPAQRKLYDELGQVVQQNRQTWGFYSPATSLTPVEAVPLELRWPLPYQPWWLRAAKPKLLIRGDVSTAGPTVDVGWPAIFGPVTDRATVDKRPRTVLADWLADPQNPLTARVWANRIWMYHFGRGLVSTPSDFGVQCEPPSHPGLLDWLSAELMSSNWSTKHIHRLILCASAFQQASGTPAGSHAGDPTDDEYLGWSPRRLEAEAIRDCVLFTSGQLDLTSGGPSVSPDDDRQTTARRSLYLRQQRDALPYMQSLFDGPNTLTVCSQRRVSTAALQPLFMLNSDFMIENARAFAGRVVEAVGSDEDRQIDLAFQLAFGRRPDPTERRTVLSFLAQASVSDESRDSATQGCTPKRLIQLCHALLNANQFVYVE